MIVITAKNIPEFVRGYLRRWFIEPKPNVFVSSIKKNIFDEILEYLNDYISEEHHFIAVISDNSQQGFDIITKESDDLYITEHSKTKLISSFDE